MSVFLVNWKAWTSANSDADRTAELLSRVPLISWGMISWKIIYITSYITPTDSTFSGELKILNEIFETYLQLLERERLLDPIANMAHGNCSRFSNVHVRMVDRSNHRSQEISVRVVAVAENATTRRISRQHIATSRNNIKRSNEEV